MMHTVWSPPRFGGGVPKALRVKCAKCSKVVAHIKTGLEIARSHDAASEHVQVTCPCGHEQKIPVSPTETRQ